MEHSRGAEPPGVPGASSNRDTLQRPHSDASRPFAVRDAAAAPTQPFTLSPVCIPDGPSATYGAGQPPGPAAAKYLSGPAAELALLCSSDERSTPPSSEACG